MITRCCILIKLYNFISKCIQSIRIYLLSIKTNKLCILYLDSLQFSIYSIINNISDIFFFYKIIIYTKLYIDIKYKKSKLG